MSTPCHQSLIHQATSVCMNSESSTGARL
jgi:hypothetical protein